MSDTDECRKEFEAWVGTFPSPSPLDRGEAGNYLHRDVWFSWEAWKAAWSRRAEFDAESPAGMSKSAPEVTANSERVQIQAESKHETPLTVATFSRDLYARCPKCTGPIPVGKHCGGPNCPLRK